MAAPIDGLAIIALCQGDFDAAAGHATEAMGILERSVGVEHPSHATVATGPDPLARVLVGAWAWDWGSDSTLDLDRDPGSDLDRPRGRPSPCRDRPCT